jgi:hypothetical protein
MNILKELQTWVHSLDKQPKQQNTDEIRIMEHKEFVYGRVP